MRKLGWKKNRPDKRDYIAPRRSKGRGDRAPIDYLVNVYDQGSLSSCVAFAVLLAIEIELRKNKKAFEEYSFLYEYYHSRVYTHDQNEDGGTYIRNACKAINRYGLCKAKHWPYKRAKVNTNPGFLNRLRGYRFGKTIKFQRLTASNICKQIDSYLDNSQAVIFGTSISKEFFNWKKGDSPIKQPKREDIIGGHAMVIVDRTVSKGRKCYVVASSWGDDFGHNGMILMDEDYIKWMFTRDFTVLELV